MQVRLAAFILATLCLAGCNRYSHTVKIKRAAIQAVVNQMVPVDLQEQTDLSFPASLSKAEVVLDEANNQLGLRVSFSARPPAPPVPKPPGAPPFRPPGAPAPPTEADAIEGILSVTGELIYDGDNGAFYIKDPNVQEVEVGTLPRDASTPLSAAAEKLIGKYLSENPIYTLDDDNLIAKAAKALLKSVEVKDDAIHITLGL